MARIRVGIVEDHQLVLDGIRRLVEEKGEVVGIAANGRDALAMVAECKPDVILMDIALPQLNGLDAARQIKRTYPSIRIVFVTVQTNRDYVKEAFEIGGSGYVLKQAASSELMNAIDEVCKGRYFLSSLIAEKVLNQTPSLDQPPLKLFGALTLRQREVLQLVAEGKSAKEIASALYISVKTVEFHKKHLMEELSLRTSAELIRYAVEKGFVSQ